MAHSLFLMALLAGQPEPVDPIAPTVVEVVAPAPVDQGAPPGELVKVLIKATKERNWGVLAGAALMLVVWSLRRMVPKLPPKWLPLVTLGIGGIPALAVALMHPAGVNTDEVVMALLAIWLMASGSWSGIVEPVREALRAWVAKPPDTKGSA